MLHVIHGLAQELKEQGVHFPNTLFLKQTTRHSVFVFFFFFTFLIYWTLCFCLFVSENAVCFI